MPNERMSEGMAGNLRIGRFPLYLKRTANTNTMRFQVIPVFPKDQCRLEQNPDLPDMSFARL